MIARPSTRTGVIVGAVAAVAVCAAVAVVVGNQGSHKPVAQTSTATSTPAPTPTPTPTRTTKPAPKPVPAVNPLTGVGAPPKGPVIAVKIDDTENGRPSVGLDQADVVYIEQAEGGLTRLVAVFGTHKPTVEPVRSVRASDAELLSQYGPITLVASGGGGDSLTTLDSSIVKGVINDRGGPGFGRDGNRPAPYNLSSNLAEVSAAVHTGGSRSVGFTFARTDPRVTAAPAAPQINTTVGGTAVTFVWNARTSAYERTIFGSVLHTASGAPATKANVIVQFCQVTVNPGDVDVVGNPSQFTHSVGSGSMVLFRNGHRIAGKWSWPSATSPTTYTDLKGKPLPLAPGGAYVVLAANGASA